jgi:predicted methyltransferase
MLGNLVEREVNINAKLTLIALASDHDDTLAAVGAQDLDRESKDFWVHLLVGATDSTTGLIALEESNGDGVWTRIWSKAVAADTNEFIKLKRSKRYIRMPAPGLEEATTTTMALTLFY